MSDRKKLTLILISLAMALVISVIAIIGIVINGKDVSFKHIDQIKAKDGVLLTAKFSNGGEVSSDDDYWSSDYYELMCDGTLNISVSYNKSGDFTGTYHLSDEELEKVYRATYEKYCYTDEDDLISYGADTCSWTVVYHDDQDAKTIFKSDNSLGSLSKAIEILEGYKANIPITLGEAHVVYRSENLVISSTPYGNNDSTASQIEATLENGEVVEFEGLKFEIIYFSDEYIVIKTGEDTYEVDADNNFDTASGLVEFSLARGESVKRAYGSLDSGVIFEITY